MKIQRLTWFSGMICYLGLGVSLIASEAIAQSNLYIYPKAGQNPQQQAQDQEKCHQWAVEESAFDPNLFQPQTAQTSVSSSSNSSSLATGAIATVVDDPFFGRITRSNFRIEQRRWDQYQQQQIDRQSEQGLLDYNRAFISCMSAKDYEVK